MNAGTCACPAGARCENPGKHPCDAGWPDQASDDPGQAARWWRPRDPAQDGGEDWRPRANIGLLMGDGRHFLVDVDISGDKTGDESLATLIAHHGQDLPHTLTYQTGSGGRQFVMLAPPETDVRNSVSELAAYLDIRGHHGFGIAPPSISGKGPYSIVADVAPQPPPTWLADWLRDQQRKREERLRALPKGDNDREVPAELSRRASAYVRSALQSAVERVAGTPESARNNSLNKEAWGIFSRFAVAGLLDPGDAATAFKSAAESCGLYGAEIARTIRSAYEGALAKPRSGELPDWLFEKPVPPPSAPPTITKMVRTFEELYQLRRASTGEFISRPEDPSEPPIVGDIDEELGYVMMRWWRADAEAWNDGAAERIGKIDPDAPPKKDDDKGDHAVIFPPVSYFSNALEHLRSSASGHKPVIQHIRCCSDGRTRIIVDLADETGRVILITARGFMLADPRDLDGQPWFRRGVAALPQHEPEEPGDVRAALADAATILNLSDEQWRITLCGLIGAHFPDCDKPGWWLTGPSGCGKTTRGRMISGWVDPVIQLGARLNLKRDERDARTRAMHEYVLTFDNLSAFSQDLSDWWCRLHTGASENVRKLHSDNTMLSFSYKRQGLATSLALPEGLQSDALRRVLHLDLPPSDGHLDSSFLWRKYLEIKPKVLGALYMVLSGVLRELEAAEREELADLPEMSDFARYLRAADRAYQLGLYDVYVRHSMEVQLHAAADSPLVGLLRDWLESLPGTEFTGTPEAFYEGLGGFAGLRTGEQWWPKSPAWLDRRLTKLHLPLSVSGILFEKGWGTAGDRQVTVRRVRAVPLFDVPPEEGEEMQLPTALPTAFTPSPR
jgi:Bifunctional DNA primase/polymerase, N-terminal